MKFIVNMWVCTVSQLKCIYDDRTNILRQDAIVLCRFAGGTHCTPHLHSRYGRHREGSCHHRPILRMGRREDQQ